MKKSAAAGGVVVVLAAAWLGATWYTGKRVEAESPARIADINQKLAQALPGYGVKLEQIGFERGFFSSHARYGISAIGPGHAADQPQLPGGVIEIDMTIDHGPFPLRALARGSVLPKLAYVHAELARTSELQPWFDAAQGKAPLSSDQIISYDGDSSGTADIAPVHVESEGVKLDFGGATTQSTYSPGTQAVQGAVQMPSLAFDTQANPSSGTKASQFRVEGVAFKVDAHTGKSKLSVGSSELSIKHLDIKAADEPPMQLALDDVRQTVDSHETGDTLSVQVSDQIGGLKVKGVDLGSGQLVFKLAGMNGAAAYDLGQAFGRFAAQLRQQRQQAAGGMKNGDQDGDDAGKAAAGSLDPSEVVTALRAALAGSPTLSVDPLLLKNDKGESRLTVTLDLKQPSASAPGGTMQAFLLQAIKSADAHLILSQPMMRQLTARYMAGFRGMAPDQADKRAQQQIAGLAVMGQMMGLARSEGENLVSDFHYADGKMLLNGRDPKLGSLLANPPQ